MFQWHLSCAYNEAQKAKFHAAARTRLRQLAKALDLPAGRFDIRSNRGGIAVSGEITLHADTLYIQISQPSFGSRNGVLIRTCQGRRDFTGGPNTFADLERLEDPKLLASFIKTVTGVKRQASAFGVAPEAAPRPDVARGG
ncbi:hypothetical protein [Asticcacaulis endophyticus]|uniref:Uncharacterized protein n=1 Tax=Asticcacaulis endophyticus TaxID=1395890 RepID=A0A918UTY5_9CAUL|nr:hypothetical protein [Asticcacaulis endophyticus]GGZ32766.1 hypothetical protein GCM10011273_18750 [Asticcacaulis endophyticus]